MVAPAGFDDNIRVGRRTRFRFFSISVFRVLAFDPLMFAKGRIRRGGTLERFHKAQASTSAGYDTALAEIRRGRKTSHWIWYIFPQIEGLGRSSTARAYALRDLAEACFLPQSLNR